MVENSLGRFWQEKHPDERLKAGWKYYIEAVRSNRTNHGVLNSNSPESIKIIDPCQGSGHILAYVFDVLMQIYEAYGYTARDAVYSIVKNNIWGLDIDERAAQLAYFSVMMKARQYDRRFFNRGIQPHVYAIEESDNVDENVLSYFCNGDTHIEKSMMTIINELKGAKEYGSLLHVTNQDWKKLYARFDEINKDISIYRDAALQLLPLVQTAETMSQRYSVVITNPPYMGSSLMPNGLKKYINSYYSDYKSDIFACFIVRCTEYCEENGYIGLLTPYVWMFLTAHEKLRAFINANVSISTLIQFEYNAFEAACVPVATYTMKRTGIHGFGEYIKLSDFRGAENQAPKVLEAIDNPNCGYRYTSSQDKFVKIPGAPIAYWVSEQLINNFSIGVRIDAFSKFTGSQNITADNERFLREIWEVDATKLGPTKHWSFYIKGGQFRKWYGNIELAVDWSDKARNFYKTNPTSNLLAEQYRFKEGITYTELTSSVNSFRYLPPIAIFDKKGPCIVDVKYNYYCLGFFNSIVAVQYFKLLNPTVTLQVKDVKNTPIIINEELRPRIEDIVKENIRISKMDWDSFETSWDFKTHPFLEMKRKYNLSDGNVKLEDCYKYWEIEAERRFKKVKENEEELNNLFIKIYGLEGELEASVSDKDITIRKADRSREVKSLISYAVGCMFGRYSLDQDKFVFAGGEWRPETYNLFKPDEDAILPICDDEYFNDDILSRFVDFLSVAFGKNTLEDNLQFIAESIGGKGQSRQIIRNYFLNDFFKDHCSTYAVLGSGKRPIYWLFDSGRKNGFKCLVYMHRYHPDTIARIRTDYIHEQQSRYRTAIEGLQKRISGSTDTSERVKLNRQLQKVEEQADELRKYEEKIHHLADQMIRINLDDGFKINYAKFGDVLAKVK